MARKTATAPKATSTKKPKAENAAPTASTAEYSPREKELMSKYPHQTGLVAGSHRAAGGRDGWGTKHTVLIRCAYPGGCDSEPIVRATSDLWFATGNCCPKHAKLIRANRRATSAEKKNLK